MTFEGGRDTQTDLYGNAGGYKTILSAKTWKNPCLRCGSTIIKEAYMGGSVYYCSNVSTDKRINVHILLAPLCTMQGINILYNCLLIPCIAFC